MFILGESSVHVLFVSTLILLTPTKMGSTQSQQGIPQLCYLLIICNITLVELIVTMGNVCCYFGGCLKDTQLDCDPWFITKSYHRSMCLSFPLLLPYPQTPTHLPSEAKDRSLQLTRWSGWLFHVSLPRAWSSFILKSRWLILLLSSLCSFIEYMYLLQVYLF